MAIVLAVLIISLDQCTKFLATIHLPYHRPVIIIPNWINLFLTHNTGAVFGFLSSRPQAWRTIFLVGFTLVALFIVAVYFYRAAATQKLLLTGLSLVVGGGIGNLIDRLRFRYVVDFIDVHWRYHHWPTFNLADSAISVGVGLLILDLILHRNAMEN